MGIVLHDTYGYLRYVLVPVGEVFYGYGAAVPQRLVSVPRYLGIQSSAIEKRVDHLF